MTTKTLLSTATRTNALLAIAQARTNGWREADIHRIGTKAVRAELALMRPTRARKAKPVQLAAQVNAAVYRAPAPAKQPKPRRSFKLTTESGGTYYVRTRKQAGDWLVSGQGSKGRVFFPHAQCTFTRGQALVVTRNGETVLRTSRITSILHPQA